MAVQYIPDGYHTITPYLVVKNTGGLIQFLITTLGAEVKSKHQLPDGNIMHAELKIGNSMLMIGDASDKWPPVPAMLYLYLPDVDSVYKKLIDAGAESLREPTTEFYGDRNCGVRDAWGNQWWIACHVKDVTAEEMERRQKEWAAKPA